MEDLTGRDRHQGRDVRSELSQSRIREHPMPLANIRTNIHSKMYVRDHSAARQPRRARHVTIAAHTVVGSALPNEHSIEASRATSCNPGPPVLEPGMPARPFRVLGVQQIAIGAPSKGPLHKLWVELLGAEVIGNFRSETENVDEEIVAVGDGVSLVEIDLMQPIDPEKSPKVHQPALNHVGLWVDDLQNAVDWLTSKGVRFAPGGIRKGAAGYEIAFIHPKGSPESPQGGEGVLIELVQAPKEIVEEYQKMSKSRMVYIPDLDR